jgi:hypothetical protein
MRFLRRIVDATGGAVSLEELLIDKESRRGPIDDAAPSLPSQEPSHAA